LANVSNGNNYDEFCDANKEKEIKKGHAVFVAECINNSMLQRNDCMSKCINSVMGLIPRIKIDVKDNSRESTESRVDGVCCFFVTLAKTKKDKQGYINFITTLRNFVDNEKNTEPDTRIPPKAKFALMDLIEGRYKI